VNKFIIIAVLSCALLAYAQKPSAPKAVQPKSAAPEISEAFSKVAVKALVTIQGTSDERLIDAAMIDETAEESGFNEKLIGFNISAFRLGKHTGQKLVDLGADPGVYTEENESKCVAAWLPKLRALSMEMPKECDILLGKPKSGESK
jgi:hypothetical protein